MDCYATRMHALRLLAAVLPALLAACANIETATPAPAAAPAAAAAPQSGQAQAQAQGVEFIDTRLSAAGALVDLRYRVLDADKAAPLLDRKLKPVLINTATGRRYYVPLPPVVGALRQVTRGNQTPQVGRTYFMLFANPDRELHAGDKLALYIGEQRVGEFSLQ